MWQCVLNVPALRNLFSPHQLMNASFNRWGLGNAYGAFGSMTEFRDEIIIEGTLDPNASDHAVPTCGGAGGPMSSRASPGMCIGAHPLLRPIICAWTG